MSETMAGQRAMFTAPAGPEALRIPAEPARLSQAAQQLRELADALGRAGEELGGAEGRHQDRDGSTTSTVLGVARWNGRRLGKDAALLTELAEATEHEAQLLGDVQGHDLPALRRRWEQARGDFLAAMRGAADAAAQAQPAEPGGQGQGGQGHGGQQHGGQGHGGHGQGGQAQGAGSPAPHQPAPDAHALMQHIDDNQLHEHHDLFSRLLGTQVAGGGGSQGDATFLDARSEQAVASYRQAVRSVLDEFAAIVERVRQAERRIEEREVFPRTERDEDEGSEAMMVAAGGLVSAYPVLRDLVKDLQSGAQASRHASETVARIGQALRDGQLPDRSREHEPGEGFRVEWQRHFDRRHDRLRTVGDKVEDVLQRFQRLDEECARAIRAR
jgi:hypothetical protein